MATRLRNGEVLLFVGDSITDCNRRSTARPLGEGYVKLFADFLCIREPEKSITVINKGISGNRVTDLDNRWADDVLRHKPDWLSILIGINDSHSVLRADPAAVPPDRFKEVYNSLLKRTRIALPKCRIILIDPFYISSDKTKGSLRAEVLQLLPKYLRVVKELSQKHHTCHVPIHAVFQKLLRYQEPDMFCPEPVHPNLTGHLVIAEMIWRELAD